MCRTTKRRCRHNPQRDRQRRAAMKTYRADLASAAAQFAGPSVIAVIDSAPSSALAPIATILGLDCATVSSVAPHTCLTHDISGALRELAAAQEADRLASAPVIIEYTQTRGYVPLHPLPGPITSHLAFEELFEKYGAPSVRTLSSDISGGWPLTAEELDQVESAQQRDRQNFADLMVASARQERETAMDPEIWQQNHAREQETIQQAEASCTAEDGIDFHSADGSDFTISAGEVKSICQAYGRLSGRSDINARFFATNSDAALAHAAYLTRCDSPLQAIGPENWADYIARAKGDENQARHDVAADVVTTFVREPAVVYTTRASDSYAALLGARKIRDHAETVAERWSIDTAGPWSKISSCAPGNQEVRLDGLLRPRNMIAEEPFGMYDGHSCLESGGMYLPESNVLDELAAYLKQLNRSDDDRVAAVAGEIVGKLQAVRTMPASKLAEHTERQWRLVELADAAERLCEDPNRIEDVTFLPVNDPDQMGLFALIAAT